MGYLRGAPPGPNDAAYACLREHYGFVPAVFRAQTLLPALLEAEVSLASAVAGLHLPVPMMVSFGDDFSIARRVR